METRAHAWLPQLCPTYPQDLSGDVGYPVFLERVALGVLHEVCDGPGPAELHNKLKRDKTRCGQHVPPVARASQMSAHTRVGRGAV